MARINSRFEGIWIPERELGVAPVGLSAQFTDNAEDYATKYASSAYFKNLVERAFALSGWRAPICPKMLDIGAGAGDNSVFPCLDLFGTAEIIATDLSPNLLAMLRREVDRRDVANSVAVVCVDAMLDVFAPSHFDLVTGAAILHHLIHPSLAIVGAYRALKPDGVAIFIEPFELGHSVLTLTFERIMAEARLRSDGLNPTVLHFMHQFTVDVRRRLGRDKSAPIFREVDDKWIFSETYFREFGEAAGFAEVKVEPVIHAPMGQISNRANALLSLTTGSLVADLPTWAQTLFERTDAAFSETQSELIFEGIVTMRKS